MTSDHDVIWGPEHALINSGDHELRRIGMERLRSMTPQEKFAQMLGLNEQWQQQQLLDIKRLYPDADEYEIKMRLASRRVRNLDMLKEFYGWDVNEKGF